MKQKPKSILKRQVTTKKCFIPWALLTAKQMSHLTLKPEDAKYLIAGFQDITVDGKSQVNLNEYQPKIRKFLDGRSTALAAAEKSKGKAFLEKFLKEGGKQTSSGLAYKILKPGSDKKPTAESSVEVHYHGTFIDGKVFDSSKERKQKATFPLNRVIKGWTEGLQLIGEGGELRLVIPSDLAYGDRGSPPRIPGGATLIFDLTLYKIVK